jgi:quercetin dioxygenase-like cupin family protein
VKALASEAFVSSDGEWETMAPGVTRKILGYDDALMMVVVKFETGAIGALHHHPHRQVSYVAAGKFDAEIDGVKRTIKAGDCFFVAPDLEHGVVALEPGMLIDVFAPAREDFLK